VQIVGKKCLWGNMSCARGGKMKSKRSFGRHIKSRKNPNPSGKLLSLLLAFLLTVNLFPAISLYAGETGEEIAERAGIDQVEDIRAPADKVEEAKTPAEPDDDVVLPKAAPGSVEIDKSADASVGDEGESASDAADSSDGAKTVTTAPASKDAGTSTDADAGTDAVASADAAADAAEDANAVTRADADADKSADTDAGSASQTNPGADTVSAPQAKDKDNSKQEAPQESTTNEPSKSDEAKSASDKNATAKVPDKLSSPETPAPADKAATNTVNIKYDGNGGISKVRDPEQYKINDTVEVKFFPEPIYVDKTLLGHPQTQGAEGKATTGTDSTNKSTATADDATADEAQAPNKKVEQTEPKNLVFAGWSTDPNATTPTYAPGAKTSFEVREATKDELILYAVWVEEVVTSGLGSGIEPELFAEGDIHIVEFTDGESITVSVEVEEGSLVTEPAGFQKSGYILSWMYDGSIFDLSANPIMGAITLSAQYDPIQYSITYELGGGTNNPGNPNSYTIESGDITIAAPTPPSPDFTFGGWVEGSTIPAGSTGDKVFTAMFSKVDGDKDDATLTYIEGDITITIRGQGTGNNKEFTVTITNTKTGEVLGPEVIDYDTPPNSEITLEFGGYTFIINVSGNDIKNGFNLLESGERYTVVYLNGDHGIFEERRFIGLTLGEPTPEAPEPIGEAGWTFAGWSDGNEIYTTANLPPTVTGDVTYVAQWTQDEYVIIYDPGTQGTWSAADETYGAVYGDDTPVFSSNTATDHNPGYSFVGWNPVVAPTVTGDVTYVAQWTPVTPPGQTEDPDPNPEPDPDPDPDPNPDPEPNPTPTPPTPAPGPPAAPPAPPAAPAAPAPATDEPVALTEEPEVVEIPLDETPTAPAPRDTGSPADSKKAETTTPLSPEGSWALLNLILAIIGALLALVALAVFLVTRKNDDDDDEGKRRQAWPQFVTLLLAIVGCILFFLTEDLSLPMRYVDGWTIWQVVVLAALILFVILGGVLSKTVEKEEKSYQEEK
jgi:uncharacterized repeat protein (TIGR02543 family)